MLGDEYDEALREALSETLREFTAQAVDHWHGVAGSQEIERLTVEIDGASIEVESETYVGLSIAGDEQIVQRIATRASRAKRDALKRLDISPGASIGPSQV